MLIEMLSQILNVHEYLKETDIKWGKNAVYRDSEKLFVRPKTSFLFE